MAKGTGLAVLGGAGLNFLGGYLGTKRRDRELEQRRNAEIEDNLDKRLYEMSREGDTRAASYLDKKYGLALDDQQPGFGALARPYVSLGELDRSKMLSPTDVRLSNLRQGEDFRNFEQRVAPQAPERSSSAFVGPFQVGAEMVRRKTEEAQAAKRDYQAEIERRSIDDAYKGVDELAQQGRIPIDEYKKVLAGKREWLTSGDKTKIYMPEQLSKVESALELRKMDRADVIRNQALNNLAKSFDFNTSELRKLENETSAAYADWDKIQKGLEETGTDPGRIEIFKEKRLYKRLDEIDKRRKDAQKRQEGLLEREAELLGNAPGKMAGKPTAEPPPEVKLKERADDFQTSVYNSYLSGLQQQFEDLAEKNRPKLKGGIFTSYTPVVDDEEDLRNFVQGTLGLESYDVRQPEAIYQAMKAKALEKMQADFAQAYPELAPKQEQKPKAPENLRAPLLKLLQLSKVQNPENYIDDFYELNPDLTLEEVNAKIQELENAGR